MVESQGGIAEGARAVLELRRGPLALRWSLEHRNYQEGRRFDDYQVRGPFKQWQHRHLFVPLGEGDCYLEDYVEYQLPMGALGGLLADGYVRRALRRAFRYRHHRVATDLMRHRTYSREASLRIAVAGASGLIGSNLVHFLTSGGHRVDPLVRRQPRPRTTEIYWDPTRGEIDASALEGVDVVVNLIGVSIGGYWTRGRKQAILSSRVQGTRLLAETLARLNRPPRVFISASAVGYYGDTGDHPVTEEAGPGNSFLAGVCRAWEEAAQPAARAGVRVVNTRSGVVVSGRGGFLKPLLIPARLGLGATFGAGRQYVSWVSMDDMLGALYHIMFTPELSGPVNVASPKAVTNAQLVKTLGRVLGRPAFLRIPGPALKLALGEASGELLGGVKALPSRLEATGFRFVLPALEDALRVELGRWKG